jgi:hypothetical protein
MYVILALSLFPYPTLSLFLRTGARNPIFIILRNSSKRCGEANEAQKYSEQCSLCNILRPRK